MGFEQAVHAKAIALTEAAIEMTSRAGSGHPTSAASLAHLVAVLMYDHMRYEPDDPARRGSDRLVLSEGHACPIVYAAAADLGIRIGRERARAMTREDALRLRDIDSEIDGHPNPAEGFPFFPAATGSLGQGLSVACGLALAARLDGSDARAFCILGDGESREGQVWEAVDFLVDHGLTAVCPIFNCNGFGQTGRVSRQQSVETLSAKLRAAGVDVEIIDGHAPLEIRAAFFEHARRSTLPGGTTPLAIVARTVKGWGAAALQRGNQHGKPVAASDLERVREELAETARRLGARADETALRRKSAPPAPRPPRPASAPPAFRDALARYGEPGWAAAAELATRKAYGVALRALGHADPRVVALDGDVSNSTYAELFAHDEQLAPRFFECRIAEQHMLSCAVGLWAGGYAPFASSFGKFVVRGYDQLELAVVTRAAVRVVGSHCGVSLAADGPSQMALPDVSFFRSFAAARGHDGSPLCYVLQPADARATYALTLAMARHEGPCYLRTFRPEVPAIYGDEASFALGGHAVVAAGRDLLIVAAGYMLHEARASLPAFAERGVRPTLLDLYSLPFDSAAVAELARANRGFVLTVEDNYAGGLGAAVAEALAEHAVRCRLRSLFVRRPPKSGRTPEDVLDYLALSSRHVVQAGIALIEERA